MITGTSSFSFFFFNDTATTEIYTLSLHDALPISLAKLSHQPVWPYRLRIFRLQFPDQNQNPHHIDRKSTRLNSSHGYISYAVFCLKKKKECHSPASALFTLAPYTITHHTALSSGD